MKFKWLLFLSIWLFSINAQADDYEDYKTAHLNFTTLMVESERNHQLPPMFDDATYSSLITQLTSDEKLGVFIDTPQDNLEQLIAVCSLSNDIYKRYFRYNQHGNKQLTLLKMEQNIEQFQNEMIAFHRFNIKCMAGSLPKLEAFYHNLTESQRTPVRKQGLMLVRTGIIQLYTSGVTLIDSELLTSASKNTLLTALVETAPYYVSVMSKDDRKNIKLFIEKTLSTVDEPYKIDLYKIIEYLSVESCHELCNIS